MRRVVITGLGIVSALGNEPGRVSASLRAGRSGINFIQEYADIGMSSCVAAVPNVSELPPIDRKQRRFMGDVAIYAYHAMRQSILDAGLRENEISDPRIGLIAGSGAGSNLNHIEAIDTMRQKGAARIPPYMVPRVMGNTVSACLATAFQIKGTSYSITSACATSAQCIGNAMELIVSGNQDIVFAGGAEEVSWVNSLLFDAMGALSRSYNATPQLASRPYDQGRDGFVIAGGAGMLVLEEAEHAQKRGARIYAELAGYGASSDGEDMVVPSQDGAARAMRLALANVRERVDYVNTHATSTPAGDLVELRAMRDVFSGNLPCFSSTKGMTGHSIGAAGAQEAIYSLLMMRDEFIAPSINIETIDPEIAGLPLVRTTLNRKIDTFMSNSFGFGGTNASLVFRRYTS